MAQLVAGLSLRRPKFDPVSGRVGFVVDEVALGQDFFRVFRFSHVSFIPPVLHYTEKSSSSQGFTTSLQGCGASVASSADPLLQKK
jgi:hypothetical protein